MRLEIYAWSYLRSLLWIDEAQLRNRLAAYPDRLLNGPGALRSPTRAALPIGDLVRRLPGKNLIALGVF